MGANRNASGQAVKPPMSLADGGMGANRNAEILAVLQALSLADGGMGANRNAPARRFAASPV